MIIVNPNNRINSPFAAIEPPLWAGLIASYHNADILDAEALDFTADETELAIRDSGHKDVLIVVMGNNPSVSSTPKMPVAEAVAKRIPDLNVSFTGIHPIAAGCKWPVVKTPFVDFPMMPWDKLPMNLYRAHNWHCLDGDRSPYASIYTSLGCPFKCYYCNIHTLYGKPGIKFRPITDILKEIDTLYQGYGVRNIKFWDELFALKEDRVMVICQLIEDRHYDLNIWAYARLDTITEKMLKAMSRAGIKWLAYGFESVKDKKFVKRTEEVIKMTRTYGINIIANFMFGLPGTTEDDDKASVEFAKDHLFEYVNFYDAKPYPGSQWWNDAKDYDWTNFYQYGKISEFRQKAFQDYMTNPDYISHIENKFGIKGVDEIRRVAERWKVLQPSKPA